MGKTITRFMTVPQVSDWTLYSTESIRLFIRKGLLKASRPTGGRGRWRMAEHDVRDFVSRKNRGER